MSDDEPKVRCCCGKYELQTTYKDYGISGYTAGVEFVGTNCGEHHIDHCEVTLENTPGFDPNEVVRSGGWEATQIMTRHGRLM